jgi:hypothetical protein
MGSRQITDLKLVGELQFDLFCTVQNFALKGPHISAQGRAKHRPGYSMRVLTQALKGRHK